MTRPIVVATSLLFVVTFGEATANAIAPTPPRTHSSTSGPKAAAAPPAVPVLDPTACTYLVGAPPGALAASTEETESGTGVSVTCNAFPPPYVSVGDTGPNSVQLSLDSRGSSTFCRISAWTGHHFAVAGTEPVDCRATIRGAFDGLFEGVNPIRVVAAIDLDLIDLFDGSAQPVVLASRSVFTNQTGLWVSGSLPISIMDNFGWRLEARLQPGHVYAVRLTASVDANGPFFDIDLGSPGSGRNVHYDSIEICLSPVLDGAALRTEIIEALIDDDLELRLYSKECLPTVWMPAAQGGRLERARALAADLLTRAIATGDPGVNSHVAQMRLDAADAQIADGQYQHACRSLSDAIRTLTTP